MIHAPPCRRRASLGFAFVLALLLLVGLGPAAAQSRVAVVGADADAVAAVSDVLGDHTEIRLVAVTAPGIADPAVATALAIRFKLNAVISVTVDGASGSVVAYEGLDGFVLGRYEVKAAVGKVPAAVAAPLWKKLGAALSIAQAPPPGAKAPAGTGALHVRTVGDGGKPKDTTATTGSKPKDTTATTGSKPKDTGTTATTGGKPKDTGTTATTGGKPKDTGTTATTGGKPKDTGTTATTGGKPKDTGTTATTGGKPKDTGTTATTGGKPKDTLDPPDGSGAPDEPVRVADAGDAKPDEPDTIVAPVAPATPSGPGRLRVSAAFEPFYRRLRYKDDIHGATLPHSLFVNAAAVRATLRPLPRLPLELHGAFELSLGARGEADTTSMQYDTTAREWSVGAGYGGRLGPLDLMARAGYGAQRFRIDDDDATERIPDLSYRWLRAGGDGSYRLSSRWRADASLGLRYLLGTGDLWSAAWFPRGTGTGLDADLGLRLRASARVDLFARFDLRHYFFGMNPVQGDPLIVGGAVDTYLGASVGAALTAF